MSEIDLLLDIYLDCQRALSKLPDIAPESSEDMRRDLLAMEPARRTEEREWLKAHLVAIISAMAEGQKASDLPAERSSR